MAFNFELTARNLHLRETAPEQWREPKGRSTGTTIVGLIFRDGVVLAADTRATNGDFVADPECKKIHYLAPNLRCCGAGTAADADMVTLTTASHLKLLRLEANAQETPGIMALTTIKRRLYRYQGHISAALIIGGVDVHGPFLATVAPHGSTDTLPFVSMGSGSFAARAVLETGYAENMEWEEAKALARNAIRAGILNDPYSGTQVDLCILTREGVTDLRGECVEGKRSVERRTTPAFVRGTSAKKIAREEIHQLVSIEDDNTSALPLLCESSLLG